MCLVYIEGVCEDVFACMDEHLVEMMEIMSEMVEGIILFYIIIHISLVQYI